MASEIVDVKNNTLGVIHKTEIERYPSDKLIESIEKYAENYKDTDNYNYYKLGVILARMAKNKRDHTHYLKVFFDLYLDNLYHCFPEKREYLDITKKKMEEIKKDLAKTLETSKIDDATMLPRLLGMMEGLI